MILSIVLIMKKNNIFKQIIYTVFLILSLAYIIYRIFFTLPFNLGIIAIVFSVIVLLVEIWDFFDFFTYFFNILCVSKKSPSIPSLNNFTNYPEIDILIATINESEYLLTKTITACKNLNYPDKSKLHIYICDDGNRNNIRSLSVSLGVNYLTRKSNTNAKAGNYNHALKNISSPYVATFDADMAPTPDFILTALPFFVTAKEKIGFIQFPQSFINPDIFQSRFHLENKIPFEQDYFYHNIQLANNSTNSVVCCGTNTLFSREALDKIHGFSTGTISEDIATGMAIESNGYKCLALDNIQAYGIAVNDVSGFIKQRSRWARGCIQILKKFKIIRNKGLSFKQKIQYLSCISYWFFGIKRMTYLLSPLLFSLFGIIIVDCNLKTFITFWLPAYLLKRLLLDIFENNYRSSTWNKIYETILTPALFVDTLKELFGFGNTNFDVSPKTTSSSNYGKPHKKLLISHIFLWLLNILGLILCFVRGSANITIYAFSILWTISNIFYLSISIIFDTRKSKKSNTVFVPNKVKKYNKLSSFSIFFK